MENLTDVVDWSRMQFALTAIYHWLFVPLTLGLSVLVAVMETIYLRTKSERWLKATKFWMTLFGINFAIGVATGLILEFEFGTNWSNYSWFVGDIFGAPLAIEGILAFFMEATFVAVMFFGWNKVSPRFHLASTWLTAIGASLSSLWILIANAWMQYPVGMEFDPAQMRNVMDDFWALFSGIAINKFFHAVFSGWALAGVFVIGVSCFMLWKRRNRDFAILSIRTASWFGLIGLILTIWTGDGSAVQVARHQPMKLAAMEGLYHGHKAQAISAVAILNPDKRWDNDEDEYLFDISIPYGLSILAKHDPNAFVPGIADIVKGVDIVNGDTVNTVSYAERIERIRYSPKSGRQNRNGDISQGLPRRLSLFRLRLLQQRRRGNTSRGADLHHLQADGDIGKLLPSFLYLHHRAHLQAATARALALVPADSHDLGTIYVGMLRGGMGSGGSGPSALDHPGPASHVRGNLRHTGIIGGDHILDVRRSIHHPSCGRGKHYVPLCEQRNQD